MNMTKIMWMTTDQVGMSDNNGNNRIVSNVIVEILHVSSASEIHHVICHQLVFFIWIFPTTSVYLYFVRTLLWPYLKRRQSSCDLSQLSPIFFFVNVPFFLNQKLTFGQIFSWSVNCTLYCIRIIYLIGAIRIQIKNNLNDGFIVNTKLKYYLTNNKSSCSKKFWF